MFFERSLNEWDGAQWLLCANNVLRGIFSFVNVSLKCISNYWRGAMGDVMHAT